MTSKLGTSKQDQIARGAYNFLAGHGIPVHYHTIARAVYNRQRAGYLKL